MRLDWPKVKQELQDSLDQLRKHEIMLGHLEVGPQTYETLKAAALARADEDQVAYLASQMERGKMSVTFSRIVVRPCFDVPEWTFWPPRDISPLAGARRLEADERV